MGGYEQDIARFRQAVRQVNALKPDFVVICGDLVGRPRKHTFKDFIDCRAELRVPCYCAPGNHDVENVPTAESLDYYRKNIGRDYYAFTHKGYVFLVVNTQLWKVKVAEESERHDAWFNEALETAYKAGLPVFVIGHYPLFLKSPDEKEDYYNLPPAKRVELLELFRKRGVVGVLTGHTHRVIVNDFNGIQMVAGETTSKMMGGSLGFRLWRVESDRPFVHESVLLDKNTE